MTTINSLTTKLNGSWVPLLPDATTSSKGVVQVGNYLTVSNGILNGGIVPIYNTSITNSGGFAVGQLSYTMNRYRYPGAITGTSDWKNIGDAWSPMNTPTFSNYAPFVIINGSGPTITATLKIKYNYGGGSVISPSGGFRAVRVSDSSVLASNTTVWTISGSVSADSKTITFTIPSDWNYATDTIQFQFIAGTYSSYSGNTNGLTVPNGSVTATLYYNPQVVS